MSSPIDKPTATRRQFLKTSGAIAAGTAALGGVARTMPPKTTRFAWR